MSLSDFKDLYNLRKYILTIRFFPLFISIITTLLIYSIHGLFNKYFLIITPPINRVNFIN